MVSPTAAYFEAVAVGVDSEVGCSSTVAESSSLFQFVWSQVISGMAYYLMAILRRRRRPSLLMMMVPYRWFSVPCNFTAPGFTSQILQLIFPQTHTCSVIVPSVQTRALSRICVIIITAVTWATILGWCRRRLKEVIFYPSNLNTYAIQYSKSTSRLQISKKFARIPDVWLKAQTTGIIQCFR